MTVISSLLLFIMDGSNNPLIVFAKIFGVLPLSLNFDSLRVKLLVFGYDLMLFSMSNINHFYRLYTASDLGEKTTAVTSISLKFRTFISYIMLTALITGNFRHGKKMNIVAQEMKKFDKNVSFDDYSNLKIDFVLIFRLQTLAFHLILKNAKFYPTSNAE